MVKLDVDTIDPNSNKLIFPEADAPPSFANNIVKVTISPSLALIGLAERLVTAKLGGVDISTLLFELEKTSSSESQNCSQLFLALISLIDNSNVQNPVKSEYPPDKNETEG